jgi:GWxTD domain-containing protein
MKKIIFFLCIFSFIIKAQSNFDFEFDYAQFAFDSASNYVEFYYSFNQGAMELQKIDSRAHLEGILEIFIQDSTTKDTLLNNQWFVKYEVVDSNESREGQSLVGVVGFVLPKGTLLCDVKGSDSYNPENFRIINECVTINPFVTNNITISDVQLASKMVQGSENTKSIFYKNTYEVMPNPNVVFGVSQPVLFFYTELYNLQSDSLKSSVLKMNQVVYNSRGKIMKVKEKQITRNSNTRVEVGSFVLTNYPTDTYTLAIAVIDSIGNQGISTAKRFFVYNPNVQQTDSIEVAATSVISSTFGAMSEDELDDIFDKSKYIATPPEIEKYERLSNETGKREFMFEFWKNRDDNPATPDNEAFRKYFQNVELANSKYSGLGKAGWKTDRGRVFLLYGEPSEVERYPNQLETRPYEIWSYNGIEGGVYFVFADLTGFSDYTLIQSTKRGEIRDDSWNRRIIIR